MNKHLFFQRTSFLGAVIILSGFLYFLLGYQIVRKDFNHVISLFAALFVLYFIAVRSFPAKFFKPLLIAGVLFRVLLLFSVPNLSDDVYRFIWDGRVAANGLNPFAYLPSEIISMPSLQGLGPGLFEKLNSPNYYTVYPPVLQGVFLLTAKLFPTDVIGAMVFLKVIILMVEVATFAVIIAILKILSLPKEAALLYVLNPLIIVELTGNIHFDGLMILSVLLTFYLLLSNKWKGSAILLGIGIATKLIPVLFVPLLVFRLGMRHALTFLTISAITVLGLFTTQFNIENARHLLNSTSLFINHFEFNASLYYLLRWLGTSMQGYNPIAFLGPMMYLLAAICIVAISYFRRREPVVSIFSSALAIITVWFLFATIVHPWYLCLPVALSLFTKYRFPIVWSFTALLSYSAYQVSPVAENVWLIGFGYVILAGFAIWEYLKTTKFIKLNSSH